MTTTMLAPERDLDGTAYCPECLADLPADGECATCAPSAPNTASNREGTMGLIGMAGRAVVREGVRQAARSHQNAPARPAQARTPAAGRTALSAPARHAGTVAVPGRATVERAQPQREPVDGAQLLTNVCKYLKRYLYLDSDAKYWALTLWIAGTHFRDEAGYLVHETYPIAGFFSSEPGSGKTHALECLSILCPAAPSILVEPSEAAVALLVAKHHRTLLLDEGDILFGSGKRKAAIRAILNSGYKQGGTWDRVRKGDVDSIRTDGAKAIAALSVVKTGTGTTLDALMARIVEYEMHKPPPGTVMHKLRERFGVDQAGVPITGLSIGAHLNGQMAGWGAQERDALMAMTLDLPEGVELREEEKWGPLLGVGARAEANRQGREDGEQRTEGDDWAALAWEACVDMSLYGGAPDTTRDEADEIGAIVDGWE